MKWISVLLLLLPCSGYDISTELEATRLVVDMQPGDATGGTPMSLQPVVVLLDSAGKLIDTSLNANYLNLNIYARFEGQNLPRGAIFSVLEQENNTGIPFANVVNGYATFKGLKVDDLADGYMINFYSDFLELMVDSERFNVSLGPADRLSMELDVGSATGGLAFLPNPIVALVDRGGNIIEDISEGYVQVEICRASHGHGCNSPGNSTLMQTTISSQLRADLVNGRAVFNGLAIDKAGDMYQLVFYIFDLSAVSQTYLLSRAFTVGVGAGVEVRMEQHVLNARGGLPFTQQPIVSIRDAGGNIVTEDTLVPPHSTVEFFLSNNPTVALLSSAAYPQLRMGLVDGLCTPADLQIDNIGQGYQIKFIVTMRTIQGKVYSISNESFPFDVNLGNPTSLEIVRQADGVYSGGQPFVQQPVVALVDGGGNVFTDESTSQVTATLVHNPTGFPLLGSLTETFFRGIGRFRSLRLVQASNGYIIQFSTTVDATPVVVNLTVNALPSMEFEFMSEDIGSNDRLGHSVSIDGDAMVIGAPSDGLVIQEVQRIKTTADGMYSLKTEIQRVRTRCDHSIEVQQIQTCGDGDGAMRGYFKIGFKGIYSRPIRYDIHPLVLKSYLESDLRAMGLLTIEKIRDYDCGDADDSYRWTIYFDSLEGYIPEVTVLDTGLTNYQNADPTKFYYAATLYPGLQSESTASNPRTIVSTLIESTYLSGTFKLLVGGDGTAMGDDISPRASIDLPYDATELQVKDAIETVIHSFSDAIRHSAYYPTVNLLSVSRSAPDAQYGYSWDIEFPSSAMDVYHWKLVTGDVTNLQGLNPQIVSSVVREGTASVDGQFALWFQGAGPTPLINWDESETGMQTKLQSIDTIDSVKVSRSSHSLGYVWTVTFIQTRTKGEYGYNVDPPGNKPALLADTFHLRGTGAQVLIQYAYSSDIDTLKCKIMEDASDYDPEVEPTYCERLDVDEYLLLEDMPVMGKAGLETGAAYVSNFNSTSKQWVQGAKLMGSDSKPYDKFGQSVSIDRTPDANNDVNTVVVVGSPYASYEGDLEKQIISCNADSGVFAIRFRSHLTAYLDFDITAPNLEIALESIASITDVSVEYYKDTTTVDSTKLLANNSGDGLCSSSIAAHKVIAVITILYPNNGDLPPLEGVVVDEFNTVLASLFDSAATPGINGQLYGEISVTEYQKGSVLSKVEGDDGYKTGAAYVFTPNSAGDVWTESSKLLAQDAVAGDEFGYQVAVYIDTIVVSAPNHDYDSLGNLVHGAGALFVFKRDAGGVWLQTQKLTIPNRTPHMRVGVSIAVRGDTVIAGSIEYNEGSGRVYIWKRLSQSLEYLFDQAIDNPAGHQPGDWFGCSLSKHDNTLIIGAQGYSGTLNPDETHVNLADPDPKYSGTGKNLPRSGIAYSYTRLTYKNAFTLHQSLLPRSPRAYARFGHALSIERNLLVVLEQEEFRGNLTSRRFVYEVRTSLSEEAVSQGNTKIGNVFALSWRAKRLTNIRSRDIAEAVFSAKNYSGVGVRRTIYEDVYEDIQTRWMKYNTSAEDMQTFIDKDLGAGDILVSRSAADEYGGHTWLITFVELSTTGGLASSTPRMGIKNRLSGQGSLDIRLLQAPPPYIHGLGHMFKRKPDTTGHWSEHAIIRPEVQQDGDLFGYSISMKGRFAAIGAPNRDKIDASGVHGGATYVFDMAFANIQFTSNHHSVSEDAGQTSVSVSRCEDYCRIGKQQWQGADVAWGMDETIYLQYMLVDGTAESRSDCMLSSIGSSECLWVNADDHSWNSTSLEKGVYINVPSADSTMNSIFEHPRFYSSGESSTYGSKSTEQSTYSRYDYRGISDYVQNGGQVLFEANQRLDSFHITITNDDVHESPDETINMLLTAPGFRPLPNSDYWSVLTIEDDGDGGVGIDDLFDQVYASDPTEDARFGTATSVDGDISVVGSPHESNGGAVYIYRKTNVGIWELEQRITSPNTGEGFGTAVQVRGLRLIVGCPGEAPPSVYLYLWNSSTSIWTFEYALPLDASLVHDTRCDPIKTNGHCNNEHNPINLHSFYGGEKSVAINGRFAVVAAKGLEAVFIYRLHRDFQWYFFQMIKSPNYQDDIYPVNSDFKKVYVTRPFFGSSVAIEDLTLLIGAEREDNELPTPTPSGSGLTCDATGFDLTSVTEPTIYAALLSEYKNSYSWDIANEEIRSQTLMANGGIHFYSQVSCEETNQNLITITTTGIPDHPVGSFPLNGDSTYSGKPDNPHSIKQQQLVFRLNRLPTVVVENPVSVTADRNSLPQGIIGVALNGVPFLNPYTDEGDDAVNVDSLGYTGNIPDLCNGVTFSLWSKNPENRITDMYGYRSNPVCLYQQYIDQDAPQMRTGKLFPFQFDKDSAVNPTPGQRSPKLGYGLDGFPIYGPFDENGNIPTDLDACNGRHDTLLATYVYHMTPWKAPYIIGCLRGKLSAPVPDIPNNLPEFNPNGGLNARDLRARSMGAVYMYWLKNIENDDAPTTINGMDVSPQGNPYEASNPTSFWDYYLKMKAQDADFGDRFGFSLSISEDQILVGAPGDKAKPRVSWDFETGDLRGWTKTGTAFDHQPTFQDNSAFRNVYGDVFVGGVRDYEQLTYDGSSNRKGTRLSIIQNIKGVPRTITYGPDTVHRDHPVPLVQTAHELRETMFEFKPGNIQSSKHRGRFWIGTFEKRPGYLTNGEFVSDYPQGNAQYDKPVGTLISDPFPIYGTRMQFYVGGGCDIDKVYVELVVDGIPVRRVTGKCNEEMRKVEWDVGMYRFQSAYIRIADLSSQNWGHINVDDFRFNWESSFVYQSNTASGNGAESNSGSPGYAGEPDTGSVYVYKRVSITNHSEPCEIGCNINGCFPTHVPSNKRVNCIWIQEQKFQASDRRAFDMFGYSVAVNHNSGIAAIGALNSRVVDLFNHDDLGGKYQNGAVYLYKRFPERRTQFGTLMNIPYWMPVETLKFQPSDKSRVRNMQFGASLELSGNTVISGAPNHPAWVTVDDSNSKYNPYSVLAKHAGGSAYIFDITVLDVKFAAKLFVVSENHPSSESLSNQVTVTLERSGNISQRLHVAYSTIDITANGISQAKAEFCLGLNYKDRGVYRCGDYISQSGTLTFEPNDSTMKFTLYTINDDCNEPYSEYVRIQLAIPGGGPLIGEQYNALVRIDDNDQGNIINRLFCPEISYPLSRDHPQYSHADHKSTIGTPARVDFLKETELSKWILQNE